MFWSLVVLFGLLWHCLVYCGTVWSIVALFGLVAGDFMRGDTSLVYEDITKFAELKKLMEEQLEDYNMEPGVISMGLVLFRDAIEHGECAL